MCDKTHKDVYQDGNSIKSDQGQEKHSHIDALECLHVHDEEKQKVATKVIEYKL